MITKLFNSREEWLEYRRTKITGSRLGDIVALKGTGKKKGFYELVAERIALPATDQNPMDRGIELEHEAVERFEKETGKKVDASLVMWIMEENESIAISPDGFVKTNKDETREDCEHSYNGKECSKCGLITEAVEVKCLNSASHIEAFLTQEIPKEYRFQVLQYFIVNSSLKTLYFCFYDPRLSVKDFFWIEVKRTEEYQKEIDQYLEYQRKTIEEINEIVNDLTY